MSIKEINPEKYYSLHAIFKMQALPWIKSFVTLKNLVLHDIKNNGGQMFKASLTGQNQGTRYNIKGEHLIELINKMNKSGFVLNDNEQTH